MDFISDQGVARPNPTALTRLVEFAALRYTPGTVRDALARD